MMTETAAKRQSSPCARCKENTETALFVYYIYGPPEGDLAGELKTRLCLPCLRLLRTAVEKELSAFRRPN